MIAPLSSPLQVAHKGAGAPKGPVALAASILRREGILGMFRGFWATVVRDSPSTGERAVDRCCHDDSEEAAWERCGVDLRGCVTRRAGLYYLAYQAAREVADPGTRLVRWVHMAHLHLKSSPKLWVLC